MVKYCILIFFFFPTLAAGQPLDTSWEARAKSIFNQIYSQPELVLQLVVETDLRQLVREKHEEVYQPARVSLKTADGGVVQWNIRVRARGNRRKEVCYFPPLKFNFDEDSLRQQGFLPFDEIKIVNQCRLPEANQEYLYKEYLAYRLYNMLTPHSYRVRLARITYRDPAGQETPVELLGLILEPEEELAARFGAQLVQLPKTTYTHLEKEVAHQIGLFQYMIGNTDWNFSNLHNITTLKIPGVKRLTPVPYDFDHAGLVNASYAAPNEALPIKSVRNRYHKGAPMTKEELETLVPLYRERRATFQACCRELAPLNEEAARDAGQFLSHFFEMLDNPSYLEQVFVEGKQ